MLPELILDEERTHNYKILVLTGLVSVFAAFALAQYFFPGNVSFFVVIGAAVPLIYPLMAYFLEVERDDHVEKGVTAYLSIFAGQLVAFTLLAYFSPDSFGYQIAEFEAVLGQMGITGYATNSVGFLPVFMNNLSVFMMITLVALVIGSAGALILAWNASVMGAFFGVLIKEVGLATPFGYVPHATLEMTGFIIAGLVGTTASASVYRQHLDFKHWKDLSKLYLLGLITIIAGAFIETV